MNGTSDEDTQNIALVHHLMNEAFNQGNINIISEMTSNDFMYENRANPVLPPGAAGYGQVVDTLRTAFPDLRLTIEDVSASGGTVVTQWTLQGRHTGLLHGFPLNTSLRLAPTGKDVTITGASIDHVRV